MKKILSISLVLTMVLSLVAMLGITASAANGLEKSYADAKDGDVLYNVLFNQTEGVYVPKLFAAGSADVANGFKVTVADDGKSVTFEQGVKGRVYWGAPIEGLTVGEGKAYTIEAEVDFTSNNSGIYFTSGPLDGTDLTKESSYQKMIGVYGKLTGSIMLAGDKHIGKYICDGAAYKSWYHTDSTITSSSDIYNNTAKKVVVVIKDYSIYVYVDGYFFDMATFAPYEKYDNLGFSVYQYNKGAKVTIKNVVVKKGAALLSTTTFPAAKDSWTENTNPADPAYQLNKTYDAAKDGEKLLDLKMNSTSGVFAPGWTYKLNIDDEKTSFTADSLTITNNGTKAAAWYGGIINGLTVGEGKTYTFQYSVKCTNSFCGGLFFNAPANQHWITGGRLAVCGVYGNFNDTTADLQLKMGLNGGNHTGFAYDDVAYPTKVTPLVDADGFTDVRIVVNGYDYSVYVMDASKEYKLVSTVDLDASVYMNCTNLAFYAYVYNANNSMTVKNVSLYKGDLFNPAPVVPDPTPTPNPGTGDAGLILAVVALISLAGVKVAKKER